VDAQAWRLADGRGRLFRCEPTQVREHDGQRRRPLGAGFGRVHCDLANNRGRLFWRRPGVHLRQLLRRLVRFGDAVCQ
jgi:hypothetical protein